MKEFFGSGKSSFSAGGLLADDALDAVSGGALGGDDCKQAMLDVSNLRCPSCCKHMEPLEVDEMIKLLNKGRPAECPACHYQGTLPDFGAR